MSKINKISVDGAVYDIEDASVPGWAKGVDKPTYKTSELENDSNYVTEAQMNERISNIEISGGVDLSNCTSTNVLPNDHGDVKTRYRICNKSEDESPVVYFPLCKLPTDNSKNRASVILRGRIGGYLPGDMAMIDALIWNRTETGISLLNINADSFSLDEPLRVCDIVVYTNSDNTDTVYLKCKEYFVFDINLEVYQDTAQILYDGTYLTEEPSGTLSAAASTSNKRVEIYNGKLYLNGTEVGGGTGGSGSNFEIFPTDEKIIVGTHNGKNVYRQRVTGNFTESYANEYWCNTTIGNIDRILNYNGTVFYSQDDTGVAFGFHHCARLVALPPSGILRVDCVDTLFANDYFEVWLDFTEKD